MQLTETQQRVLECAARGDEANCADLDASDRRIDAEWIRGILLGYTSSSDIRRKREQPAGMSNPIEAVREPVAFGARALRIRGATVVGTLDLKWCGSSSQPLPTLSLTNCLFESTDITGSREFASIDLSNAYVTGIELVGSRLTHLRGVGMRVDGSVDIRELGPVSQGGPCWCNFSRASIGGDLLADDVRLKAPTRADWEDKYDFFELRWALNLVISRVSGSVVIRKSPVIDGGLILDSAHIHGDLQLENATILKRSGERNALALERAAIDGSFKVAALPEGGLNCDGPIWMHRVTIGRAFDLGGANLQGVADRDDRKAFGLALYAGAATVHGGVTLHHVNAVGLICLHGMHIDGSLRLTHVDVNGRSTESAPGWFPAPDWAPQPFALDLRSARIGTDLHLDENSFRGIVDLSDTECATLDEDLTRTGHAGRAVIDGLRYARVTSDWFEAGRFEEWLACDDDSYFPRHDTPYRPQTYAQLAAVFAAHGKDADTLKVILKKARRDTWRNWFRSPSAPDHESEASQRRPNGIVTAFRKLVYVVFLVPYGVGFSFGLSPLRAVATLGTCIAIGAAMFGWMNSRGAMVVTQMPIANYFKGQFVVAQASASGPASVACGKSIRLPVYAADVFIPLVDLREEPKCDIDAVDAFPGGAPSDGEITTYRWVKAIYALSGWVVTTLAVLTFSGVLRHRLSQE